MDYLIVDEAQFLTAGQVDQLADLVDGWHVDVYAFGLTTDFRARLFPGTQRLLEVADDVQRIQVEVLCWCGLPGLLNARVVDGAMVRSGETVVVADTAPAELPGERARLLPRRPVPGALPPALRARRTGPDARRTRAARALLTCGLTRPGGTERAGSDPMR